jgi:hypothetical protein
MDSSGGRRSVLVLCLPLVLGACTAAGGPSGACAGPELSVTPTRAAPGGRLLITGTAFQDGCNDAFGNGRSLDPPAKPLRHITVSLMQRGRTWRLATIDRADPDFTVTATVPADVSPGTAAIRATWAAGEAQVAIS